jgi:hypothetical protein
MEIEKPEPSRKKAKRKALVLGEDHTVTLENTPGGSSGSRTIIMADHDNLNEREVQKMVKSAGNKPGNYQVIAKNGIIIDVNNYAPTNGSFGLTIRGFKTTLKPSSSLTDGLLKDGLNMLISDSSFYDKYKSILIIL